MSIASDWLKRVLKYYLAFSVVHVIYKVLRTIKDQNKAKKFLSHLPQANNPKSTLSRFVKNFHRLHDFYADHLLETPNAPLVVGPGPVPEVICNTPEAIEWMLKSEFMHVTKPSGDEDYLFYCLGKFIGTRGIFLLRHGDPPTPKADHDEWHVQRKATSLIFTKNNFLNLMQNTFCEKADILISLLKKSADKREFVDMQHKFFAFTMDSIQKIFFGIEIDSMSGRDEDKFGSAFDNAHSSMMAHLQSTLPLILLVRYAPWPFGTLHHDKGEAHALLVKFREVMGKPFAEFERNIALLDKACIEHIEKIRGDKNIADRRDMVANYLNAKMGTELDDKALRDILLNLTIAGRDTTACALTWMFYLLSLNPEVQELAFKEIKEKLGDREPTFEELSPDNMPYLNGILYESLRLYPPVPFDIKVATADITYLDGKTVIPKGMQLGFVPYTMGRNPERYPDPYKFNPNRWIPFVQPSLFDFPVFQAGPRFCLGKDMAQFEAKLLAAKLLRVFSFELRDGEADKICYSNNITMSLCNSPDKNSYNLWIRPIVRQK